MSGNGQGPLPFAPNWKVVPTQVVVSTPGDVKLVDFNSFRVAISISIITFTGTCYINPGGAASNGVQFPISVNAERDWFYSQWGGMVQQPWHFWNPAAGGTINVLEVLWVTIGGND